MPHPPHLVDPVRDRLGTGEHLAVVAALDAVDREPRIPGHREPGGERGPHGGDDERGGQVRHEPEQVALVRAVPVQQHEQRAVAALLGGRGPQDDVEPSGDS